jgi:hypothetical protein
MADAITAPYYVSSYKAGAGPFDCVSNLLPFQIYQGWRERISEKTNKPYFFNIFTCESVWTIPLIPPTKHICSTPDDIGDITNNELPDTVPIATMQEQCITPYDIGDIPNNDMADMSNTCEQKVTTPPYEASYEPGAGPFDCVMNNDLAVISNTCEQNVTPSDLLQTAMFDINPPKAGSRNKRGTKRRFSQDPDEQRNEGIAKRFQIGGERYVQVKRFKGRVYVNIREYYYNKS